MVDRFRILVVCTGNVCRSPLAERLIRARLRAALGEGADRFEVTSAGTRPLAGHPMDPRAAAAAAELGADAQGFAARELTAEQVAGADLVLTAARAHRAAVVALCPAAHRYAFTIREFARIVEALPADTVDGAEPVDRATGLVAAAAARRGFARPERAEDDDVPDPMGGTEEVFWTVAATIADALAGPLRLVTGVVFPPVGTRAPGSVARPRLAPLRGRLGSTGHRGRQAFRRGPVIGGVLAGLSLMVMLMGGWLVVRGMRAEHALTAARDDVRAMRAALLSGDDGRVNRALADVRRRARRARELTGDPLFRLAALPPYLGNTARAVRAAAVAVHEISARVLPAVSTLGVDLRPDRLRPSGDRIAVDRIARAGPLLDTAAAGVEAAQVRLRAVDTSWSPEAVAAKVREFRTDLDRAAAALESVRRVVRLAPPMLGADEPRRYFVAFQNNAEARGTGGLLGMYAVISADRGRLRVDRLGSDTDLVDAATLPVDLGPDFAQRWGDNPAMWANSNLDPHFPNAARLWLALWERQTGQRLDGAIATDPVALSYVLRATGPMRLPTGDTISASNAVWLTMSGVYARYPGSDSARKAYMRSVAGAVLATLMSGKGDPRRLLESLARAATERRLIVYSGHPDEERELSGTDVGGGLPGGAGPYAFVVVNNTAGSKMDYYLSRSITYTSTHCAEGTRDSRIEIIFGNSAPPADRLPRYVTQRQDIGRGPNRSAVPGSVSLLVSVYGARGAGVGRATVDGKPMGVSVTSEDGRPVWGFPIEVAPGTHRTVVLEVTEPASDAPPVVPVQPLAQPQHVEISVARCD